MTAQSWLDGALQVDLEGVRAYVCISIHVFVYSIVFLSPVADLAPARRKLGASGHSASASIVYVSMYLFV